MARKKKGTPYDTQIGAETTLRYNPEISALRSSAQDVIAQRIAEIDAARSAAQGSIATSKAAIPQVQRGEADTRGLIADALAGTPEASKDVARTKVRLAERMGLAINDFAERQADASNGFQAAVLQSNSRAGSNLSKIRERLNEIGQEAGVFGQGRAAELAAADAKAQADSISAGQDRTAQLLAAGVDPDTGKILPGGVKDPAANGKNQGARAKTLASTEAHSHARTEIEAARDAAKRLRHEHPNWGRQQIADAILHGRESKDPHVEQVHDANGKPVFWHPDDPEVKSGQQVAGTPVMAQTAPGVEGFSAVTDPRWVSIGLDLALDGGVSAYNVKRLHGGTKRYSIRDLGFVTQTQRIRAGQIPPRSSSATDQLHNGPGR